jgi:hypothetical protein
MKRVRRLEGSADNEPRAPTVAARHIGIWQLLSPLVRESVPSLEEGFTVEKCRKVSKLSKIVEKRRKPPQSRCPADLLRAPGTASRSGKWLEAKRENLAYPSHRCSGHRCGCRQQVVSATDLEIANRLLTRNPETVGITQHMKRVCV